MRNQHLSVVIAKIRCIAIGLVLGMACQALYAEVVYLSQGSTNGYTLTNGNTYVVQESVSFTNSVAGGSGITVEDGASVVLYIPTGVTFTAVGGNGKGRVGGGAGICVPSNATLIVTGEGTITSIGGNAGKGGNGQDGNNGNSANNYYWGGKGGNGGIGGGGAGAAIGGVGGVGGASGSGVDYMVKNEGWLSNPDGASNGENGGNGETSGAMGKVFILGRMLMQSRSGENGTNGIAGVKASYVYRYFFTPYQSGEKRNIGGGGGGGGGGAGAAPGCPIGAGGQSGGGGGGGGSGAVATSSANIEVYGGTGSGGLSKISAGESDGTKSEYGGEGGAGGAMGAEGGEGELYVSSTADVDVDRTKLSAETHVAAQYTITLEANGGTLASEENTLTATLGCVLPDCLPRPVWQGYQFCGWKDSAGTKYYNGDLTKALSSYSVPSNVVLYAEWIDDPNAVFITPDNGTVFEDSLTVAIKCAVDDAVIHYTVDGSDPTVDSPVYTRKFRIERKTTIKAIAVSEGWTNVGVVASSYALGRCPDPVIESSGGEVFSNGQVQVSIDWNCTDGTLRYTTDGSDVTSASPEYVGAFTISETTTIKAKTLGDTYFDSDQAELTVEREWLKVETPKINAAQTFTGAKNQVSISCATADAAVYYTLDGSDPTVQSVQYESPFYVTESCIVKAIAVKYDYLDSDVAMFNIAHEWVPTITPVIVSPQTFTGTKNKVTITCASDGAAIYYTLDGSEPTTQSMRYEKPFCVTNDCVIKAIAAKDYFLDSSVVTSNVSRVWSIGETMGKCDHVFATSGDLGFVRTNDLTAALGESMRSGVIQNCQTSILSTVIIGPGTLTFKWKTSCEEDSRHEWDHAEFVLDGEVVEVLDGITDWQKITKEITSGGEHSVIWRYVKDAEEGDGEDCLWVSEYTWTSDLTETQTTDAPVPYSWLAAKCCDVVDEYDSYEKVAKQTALNGRLTVEQCYVAGVDPESYTNDFKTAIEMVDGAPHITWSPDLKAERSYKIYGSTNLVNGGDWEFPTNSLHRFFKVSVEMP